MTSRLWRHGSNRVLRGCRQFSMKFGNPLEACPKSAAKGSRFWRLSPIVIESGCARLSHINPHVSSGLVWLLPFHRLYPHLISPYLGSCLCHPCGLMPHVLCTASSTGFVSCPRLASCGCHHARHLPFHVASSHLPYCFVIESRLPTMSPHGMSGPSTSHFMA